jgi:hypothetical protein
MITQSNRLAHSYLDAKQLVISAGYAHEIDWQEDVRFDGLTEERFLREYAWVVFSSGFRESVLRNKFDRLAIAFLGLTNASEVALNRRSCRRAALRVFGHQGKVRAVLDACKLIHLDGFASFRSQLKAGGVEFIDRLPFMGPATSYHLAKNIGLDVVKPDRHLVRIAHGSGFESPHDFCESINAVVGDALAVVDIVIWRYATLYPHELLPGFVPSFYCVRGA